MSALDKLVDAVTPPETAEQRAEARSKARAAAQPGDWLTAIIGHHEGIEQAFADARSGDDAARCKSALKRLGELLNGHAMAEEAVVYPALAAIDKLGEAHKAYAEQVEAKLAMAELENLDPLSQAYREKLGHLQGAVSHHVYEEEGHWFLELKHEADAESQRMIAQRYDEEYGRYMRGGETDERGVAGEPRSFAQDTSPTSPTPGPIS